MPATRWSDSLDWTDGWGALGVIVAIAIPTILVIVWAVRLYRMRKAEAQLVTSHYRLLGGLGLRFEYEISVHNATPHPLRIVEIRFWDGAEWRPMLARSTTTGDPVVLPGDVGVASVPATTTDVAEFDNFYYFKYTDSRNRTWSRRIDSPAFLSHSEARQLQKFHGTV